MKKSIKLITLVLSLALVIGAAIAVGVSANTSAPEVAAKNVYVNGNFCLMFAVKPETVQGDTVTLKIYDRTPADGVDPIETITLNKTDTELIALDGDGVEDDDAIVFYSKGVSAKDIADNWYFTVESAGAVSDVDVYSVREYAFERLYGDNKIAATDPYGTRQRDFYLSILQVGSTAQELLVNYKNNLDERLANEYTYASIFNGSFGDSTQKFVELGDTLTLTPDAGFTDPSWKVYTYGTNGALLDSAIVELGGSFTVAGNTVVVPGWLEGATPGKYFIDKGDSKLNFDNVTFDETGFYTNASDTPLQSKYGNYSFTEVDGRGKVLTISKDGVNEIGKPSIWIPVVNDTEGNGNCLAIEFDMMLSGTMNFSSGEYMSDPAAFFSTALNIAAGVCEASEKDAFAWKSAGTATNQIGSAAFYYVDTQKTVSDIPEGSSNVAGGEFFSVIKGNYSSYNINPNTWYNVCIEMYDAPEENRSYMKMYINGEYFYGTYGSRCTAGTDADGNYDYNNPSEAKCVRIDVMDRFRPSVVSYDNIYAGIIEKEYVAE